MNLTGKYLTFGLGREGFALPVIKVREIIKVMDITEIPQSPRHVRGVINLRGRVIPVIDLRVRFEMEATPFTQWTCIIVVDVDDHGTRRPMGVIVDSIAEVLNLTQDEVDPPPALGMQAFSAHIMGLAKVKGTVKILLDIDGILQGDRLPLTA